MSLARLFGRELLGVTLHTSLLMAGLLFLYNSITIGTLPTSVNCSGNSSPS
jgi:hypothetical protein